MKKRDFLRIVIFIIFNFVAVFSIHSQTLSPIGNDFSKSDFTILPSAETQSAVEQLSQNGLVEWASKDTQTREVFIDKKNLDDIGADKVSNGAAEKNSLPFVVPNTVIIQFERNTSEQEIENYLFTNKFPVIQTFPSIGAVQIEADLSQYFEPMLSDTDPNASIMRGIIAAAEAFKSDERIKFATPDVVLTEKSHHNNSNEITNVLSPTDIVANVESELIDWGISDIEADKLWSMPRAEDGVILGVMDVGFRRHEDIIFIGSAQERPANNHGNHVAGIGCGKHNGKGTKGVIPNCFVRARSGDVFFEAIDGNPQLRFLTLFSQILTTLDNFVREQDDITTFNVSLGYNWRSNFGINPDLPESTQWRQLVELQGSLLVSLLAAADEKGKVIFSAAGNDSGGLVTPISSKYASPFNWAAIAAREGGISQNGIIVGAHGPDGHRAPFSNKDVDISCPGVNVLSALAFDSDGAPSGVAYGKMSGTSMASPYCAAGHVLLSLVRRNYTAVEIVQCMVSSSDALTDAGAPRLKLTQALRACP